LIDELYENIDPARIAWISLGSLRFPPAMKEKIIERYPHSKIPYGEFIRGQDQKCVIFVHADRTLPGDISEINGYSKSAVYLFLYGESGGLAGGVRICAGIKCPPRLHVCGKSPPPVSRIGVGETSAGGI
jgi:hypothetical protein